MVLFWGLSEFRIIGVHLFDLNIRLMLPFVFILEFPIVFGLEGTTAERHHCDDGFEHVVDSPQ